MTHGCHIVKHRVIAVVHKVGSLDQHPQHHQKLLLEIIGPQSRPVNENLQGRGPAICVSTSFLGDSGAH